MLCSPCSAWAPRGRQQVRPWRTAAGSLAHWAATRGRSRTPGGRGGLRYMAPPRAPAGTCGREGFKPCRGGRACASAACASRPRGRAEGKGGQRGAAAAPARTAPASTPAACRATCTPPAPRAGTAAAPARVRRGPAARQGGGWALLGHPGIQGAALRRGAGCGRAGAAHAPRLLRTRGLQRAGRRGSPEPAHRQLLLVAPGGHCQVDGAADEAQGDGQLLRRLGLREAGRGSGGRQRAGVAGGRCCWRARAPCGVLARGGARR